jgi:periplasmic divalent cation tolerance protein
MGALLAVLTTVATREQAQALARALVEQRLAACVQFSAIDSVYRWHGEVQSEPEWRVLCKTTAERWPAIEAAIRANHPYELPQICAFALDPVHAPYARWVESECDPDGLSR